MDEKVVLSAEYSNPVTAAILIFAVKLEPATVNDCAVEADPLQVEKFVIDEEFTLIEDVEAIVVNVPSDVVAVPFELIANALK